MEFGGMTNVRHCCGKKPLNKSNHNKAMCETSILSHDFHSARWASSIVLPLWGLSSEIIEVFVGHFGPQHAEKQ